MCSCFQRSACFPQVQADILKQEKQMITHGNSAYLVVIQPQLVQQQSMTYIYIQIGDTIVPVFIRASKNQNLNKNYERCDVDIIFNLNMGKLLFKQQS